MVRRRRQSNYPHLKFQEPKAKKQNSSKLFGGVEGTDGNGKAELEQAVHLRWITLAGHDSVMWGVFTDNWLNDKLHQYKSQPLDFLSGCCILASNIFKRRESGEVPSKSVGGPGHAREWGTQARSETQASEDQGYLNGRDWGKLFLSDPLWCQNLRWQSECTGHTASSCRKLVWAQGWCNAGSTGPGRTAE